jgi:hypothetical protein
MNRMLTSEGTAGRSNFLAWGIGLALLITMVSPRIAIAQEALRVHKRPTVGVALEGGCTRTSAHRSAQVV